MMTYSIAIASSGLLLACQPDSLGEGAVREEAQHFVADNLNGSPTDYRIERGLMLTDSNAGEVVYESSEENGFLGDEQGWVFAFAVRIA
jgi:hypothetical protein